MGVKWVVLMALVLLLAGPGPVPTNIEEGARDRAETPIDYYERLQYVQYEAFPTGRL
jgi:hypothetical protein